jgi:hypothetical protein
VFQLDAASEAAIEDVRLVYEVAPDGVRATAQPQCTGDTLRSCSFLLPASGANVLIPGAEVTYFWRITAAGATQETEPQVATYDDSRFDWQTVAEGNVTVWYNSGSESDARDVLVAARESLDRISALLQTTVDVPVKVFYYSSADEMQDAVPSVDNEEGVITLGEVVFSDTAMVSADYAPEDIARHEVAHIVVRQAIRGPYGVPDWLNEGTAVYAQSQPLSNQRDAIESAISSGNVLSVRSISSASAGASLETVSLFYGESWSLVTFLIDTYGEEKFADLFRAFGTGANTGEALQQVYGFNQDGLENAWRESVGLPPRQAVTTPDDSQSVTPTSPVGAPADTDDDDSKVVLIVIIAVVTAVIAAALLLFGVVLARALR